MERERWESFCHDRISGARAFSHVQRLSLDPLEPRSADSPLAGQHQSYKINSCMLSYVPYERVLVRGGVALARPDTKI